MIAGVSGGGEMGCRDGGRVGKDGTTGTEVVSAGPRPRTNVVVFSKSLKMGLGCGAQGSRALGTQYHSHAVYPYYPV